MSADRLNPEELALKYGVGLDHHSKLGEPLASAFADQLVEPGYSPGFHRVDWLKWFTDCVRSGSLGARVAPAGEFVPDWDTDVSLSVQELLTESAEADPSQPCLLTWAAWYRAMLHGHSDGDDSLVEKFGRSDTDIRDEVHHLVVPHGMGIPKFARLVMAETFLLSEVRGRRVACDRCLSPGPYEHIDSDDRRSIEQDAPLFVVSVGMVHIPVVLCNRHAAILRVEADEAGVKLTEVPPLSELDE